MELHETRVVWQNVPGCNKIKISYLSTKENGSVQDVRPWEWLWKETFPSISDIDSDNFSWTDTLNAMVN